MGEGEHKPTFPSPWTDQADSDPISDALAVYKKMLEGYRRPPSPHVCGPFHYGELRAFARAELDLSCPGCGRTFSPKEVAATLVARRR